MTSTDTDALAVETASGGPRTLRTLEKGLQLLSLFDIEHQQWTLRELREATGESKTNVLRVTKTLEGLGYLVRDPATRKLRLGPSIVRLSYVTLSHSELVRAAVEPMRRLSERLRETLDLMVEIELGSLMSLYDMTPRFLRTPPSIGRIVPCGVTTAASKIFVAFRPEETWDEILLQLVRPFTDRTILDLDATSPTNGEHKAGWRSLRAGRMERRAVRRRCPDLRLRRGCAGEPLGGLPGRADRARKGWPSTRTR